MSIEMFETNPKKISNNIKRQNDLDAIQDLTLVKLSGKEDALATSFSL